MKRTLFAAGAAIVGVGMISPASAGDSGMYIRGQVGFNSLQDISQTFSTTATASSTSIGIGTDRGLAAGFGAGYRFGTGLRAEGEVSYRKNDMDNISIVGVTVPVTVGEYKSWSFMANALYDFDIGSQWTPYVGAGAGLARLDMKDYLGNITGISISADETVFAGQLIGGLDYEIDANWSLGARYNLLYQEGPNFNYTVAGTTVTMDEDNHLNHTLGINLTYHFD